MSKSELLRTPQIPWNRRGQKACPGCGKIQGQRKLICQNENCVLRQKMLAAYIPYDPIKLITNNTTNIFSYRVKARDALPRSFGEITEICLFVSSLVTQQAVCYVEACQYGDSDGVCSHVKACNVEESPDRKIPNAEVYEISREVLWNLLIDSKLKQRLWTLYNEDNAIMPAVQRLNANTFVVKCDKSKTFPIGRLHVTVGLAKSLKTKKPAYSCACQKLKIILEPDNSVVMQQEVCEHLLLVLAGILSQPNARDLYKNFTNALKSFWVPNGLEKPPTQLQEDFFDLDINIGDIVDDIAADDIFIFDDKLLSNDNLPDLTDVVFDLTPADFMYNQSATINQPTAPTSASSLHAGDPKLLGAQENDIDICFNDIISTVHDTSHPHHLDNRTNLLPKLELSDCNIELMNEFELTDRIDLDLEQADSTYFDSSNGFSVLTTTTQTKAGNSMTAKATVAPIAPITITLPEVSTESGESLLKSNQPTATLEAPPIELPTIEVVKKTPLKASQITTQVKTRKFPPIHATRALIVNTNVAPAGAVAADQVAKAEYEKDVNEPVLAFSAWLEHIIESINESIEIKEQKNITHTFHVHEEIFSHFSKKFSTGVKRRMPNFTKVIKTGKYKGLIQYVWYFSSSSTVRRIFSTKQLGLEIERVYEKTNDGDFIPYVRQQPVEIILSDGSKRRIYPKIDLYIAHILFESKNEHKNGFKLAWLPHAFAKSHFGILTIEFSIGIKDRGLLNNNSSIQQHCN